MRVESLGREESRLLKVTWFNLKKEKKRRAGGLFFMGHLRQLPKIKLHPQLDETGIEWGSKASRSYDYDSFSSIVDLE
jgi:hypothetical protein